LKQKVIEMTDNVVSNEDSLLALQRGAHCGFSSVHMQRGRELEREREREKRGRRQRGR
jgi:hypothetical protein